MPEPQLRIADRCDACGAQAFVKVEFVLDPEAPKIKSDLLFCGHHYARHEDALRGRAHRVVDERDRINQRPSQSATV